MEKIHTVTIKGKDYPFAYSLSVFTRASGMPGALDSELLLNYSIIYEGIRKGCKRDNVKFPFPYGIKQEEIKEGVDELTDLLFEDKLAGGTAEEDMKKLIEEASVQYKEQMEDLEAKKNSAPMKSSDTPSAIAPDTTTGSQSQESWKTTSTADVTVT